jgi:hypothetical protein
MHWYAWVCGPLEFLGAWWLVHPPKGASWSATKKWFADFNSYEPVGPVLRQRQLAQSWQTNLAAHGVVSEPKPHTSDKIAQHILAALQTQTPGPMIGTAERKMIEAASNALSEAYEYIEMRDKDTKEILAAYSLPPPLRHPSIEPGPPGVL